MSGRPVGRAQSPAEGLSALVDGELESSELAGLLAQWRGDESTRERWHSYQLIGDVLRSDDLACGAGHDRDFLARLRERLDAEPVVLAPAEELTPVAVATNVVPIKAQAWRQPRRWSRWGANAAMAAGLAVMVVGAVNVMRPSAPSPQMASVAPGPGLSTAPDVGGAEPAVQVVNGRLIRDARLDHYLAAHQQLSGGSVLGGQAAFVRRAVAEVPER